MIKTTASLSLSLLLLCSSCVSFRAGAGEGLSPSSRPAPCLRIVSLQRRALAKCKAEREACKEEGRTRLEEQEASCRRGLQSKAIDVRQAREERDRCLSKACPKVKSPSLVLPVAVGVVVGIVAGGAAGILVGWFVRGG